MLTSHFCEFFCALTDSFDRIDGGDKSWKKRQKSDFFIIPLAVLTGQQVPLVFPKFSLGSVIFVSWIFTSLVLASSYQSMILAHLVAVNYEKPIRNTQVL